MKIKPCPKCGVEFPSWLIKEDVLTNNVYLKLFCGTCSVTIWMEILKMSDIEEGINLTMENNLVEFILRLLYEYMKDRGYEYGCSREDVVALIPHYLSGFIGSQNIITESFEIDSDSFMMIGAHKVYFTSPYKDSIIIFDKRYYKEAAIIKLPGKNESKFIEYGDEDD